MKSNLSRRDFLKLAGLASLGVMVPPSVNLLTNPDVQSQKKNVLIIVFDALTAYNISLYGYRRETMPNLTNLSKRATVFHNHYSGGNYTTPGTASILTGTLPWTHRAIRFNDTVKPDFADKSIFHVFDDYYRISFSHNTLVNTLFKQFLPALNDYIPQDDLFIFNDKFIKEFLSNDEDIATVGWARTIKRTEGFSYSLFLSQLYEKIRDNKVADVAKSFPYGLPRINDDNFFTLEDGIDTLAEKIANIPQPFLGYFHFLPPHYPYKPRQEFADIFSKDNFKPLSKAQDIFTEEKSDEFLAGYRGYYDEFILNVDYEFGRLFNQLESLGILENTWLVLTSDHGEIFERGIWGHSTAALYQPLIRVPLLIFGPGNSASQNVYTPTSAIDLLPTLSHVTGHKIPDWTEGNVLPPYQSILNSTTENGVFTVQARYNEPRFPIRQVSAMMVQENYKLIYFQGYDELYPDEEASLLFDIQADPEELNNLSRTKRETASDLLNIVKTRFDKSNEPYI